MCMQLLMEARGDRIPAAEVASGCEIFPLQSGCSDPLQHQQARLTNEPFL